MPRSCSACLAVFLGSCGPALIGVGASSSGGGGGGGTITEPLPAEPPSVVLTQPPDGASDVPTDSSVLVTLSRAPDAEFDPAVFRLEDDAGNAIPATLTVSPDGATATLTPTSALPFLKTYRVTLDAAIGLDTAVSWTFTTVTDVTPPALARFAPPDGAAGVSTMVPIRVEFDRAVTVDAAGLVVTDDSGGVVAGAIEQPSPGQLAFAPTAPLQHATRYTVTLGPSIQTTFGAPFAGFSYSFAVTDALLVAISFPPTGALVTGDSVRARGTASGAGLAEVRVNGLSAALTSSGWVAGALLPPQGGALDIAAFDARGVRYDLRTPPVVRRNALLLGHVTKLIGYDGRLFAAQHAGDEAYLVEIDVVAGEIREVPESRVSPVDAFREVAWDRSTDRWYGLTADNDLWLIDTSTRERTLLAPAVVAGDAHLTADTRRDVLYLTYRSAGDTVLGAFDLDGSGVRTLATSASDGELDELRDLVYDPATDRLIALHETRSTGDLAVLEFEPVGGTKQLLWGRVGIRSRGAEPYGLGSFSVGMHFDSNARQVLLNTINAVPSTVVRVDLASGDRSVVATTTTAGAEPAFIVGPTALAGGRLITADPSSTLFSIDVASGTRANVDPDGVGSGPRLRRPLDAVWDAARGRVLLFQSPAGHPEVLAIDPISGDRSVVADASGPAPALPTSTVVRLAFDDAGDRLLIADRDADEILAIDLGTGAREIVSGPSSGPTSLAVVRDFDFHADAGTAMLRIENRLVSVDLTTGDREFVLGGFPYDQACVVDTAGDRVFLSTTGVIAAWHLTQRFSGTVSGFGIGTGAPFGRIDELHYDRTNGELIAFNADGLTIAAAATGDRRVLASEWRNTKFVPVDLIVPSGGDAVYVLTDRALVHVDRVLGEMVLVSR